VALAWIEWTATVFGVLCVVLLMRQNIWNWAAGFVQVTLYVFVFYHAKLYSDLILHVIYAVLQIVGWYHWRYGGGGNGDVPPTSLRGREMAGWVALAITAAAIWGTIMHAKTDAAAPYADAFIMMTSLVGQWLTTRKRVESWLFWIAVDVVAIVLYLIKGLYPTSGLYTVFLFLSIAGFFAWRRDMRSAIPAAASPATGGAGPSSAATALSAE
jgi:nicotinamide mononucleotide transporter